MSLRTRKKIAALMAVFFFSSSFFTPVYPLPSGEEVMSGTATFDRAQDGSTLNINAADQSIIQYSSFNIAANETVNFYLPSDDSTLLNRILGNTWSEILGTLTGNGRIMLVNENGFYFGPNSFVDVGSLLVSTHNLSNENFLAGNYLFENLGNSIDASSASILNEGILQMREGGSAVLIADAIENRGTIRAPLGMVALAGGEKVTVGITNDGLFSVLVDEATARQILDQDGNTVLDQIKNSGTLEAAGGLVQIQAKALEEIFESAINLDGFIQADSVEQGAGGLIKLIADDKIVSNGTLSAHAGDITVESEKSLELGGSYLAEGGNITFDSQGDIEITDNLETEGSALFRQYGNWINDSDFDLGLSSILFEYIIQEMDLSNYSSAFASGFTGLEYHLVTSQPLAPRDGLNREIVTNHDTYLMTYSLRHGITMEVEYAQSNTRPLGEESIPIKQTLTFDNPSSYSYDLDLTMRSYVETDAVNWNGETYSITDEPLTFAAFDKTASVTEFTDDLGLEVIEGIESFSNYYHTYKVGHFLTYETPDGRLARFDWDDVMELAHQVTVSRQGNATSIDLTLSDLTLPAQDSLVVDPEYAVSATGSYNLRFDGIGVDAFLTEQGTVEIADVNTDGLGDLIIGDPRADTNGADSGAVYVIFSLFNDDFGNTTNNDIPLSTTTNFNIRYDGAAAGHQLGYVNNGSGVHVGDLNGDSYGDLVMISIYADNNGADSGSAYVIFSTKVDDVGNSVANNLSLQFGTVYNIRYDGAAANDNMGYDEAFDIGDLNGDGLGDLVLGTRSADNGGANRGSAWVMFSTLIDDVGSSTGNDKALSTATNYNIRYDGGADSERMTETKGVEIGDVNGDGLGDLILGSYLASYNGAQSGSAYVMFSTLVDDVGTTTGNNLGLDTSTNYNIRYDGAAASDNLGWFGTFEIGDVNGDGLRDLILGSPGADNNGNSSGSVYVLFSTLVDDVGATTGNDKVLSTSTNYNIRYDGRAASEFLGLDDLIEIGDVNGDSLSDLVVGTYQAGSQSGSAYVFLSTLIDDVGASTGNDKALSTSSNYNIRYDGTSTSNLGYQGAFSIVDVNNDGLKDLLLGGPDADLNGANSGSVWVILSTLLDDIGSSTGNVKSLANSDSYSIRYDGAAGERLSAYGILDGGDVNGDNIKDLVMGTYVANNNGSQSGSLWVVFSPLVVTHAYVPPPPAPPAPPPQETITTATVALDTTTTSVDNTISSFNLTSPTMTTTSSDLSFSTSDFVNTGTTSDSFLTTPSTTSTSSSTTFLNTESSTSDSTSTVTSPTGEETVETSSKAVSEAQPAPETVEEKPAGENQEAETTEEFKKEEPAKKEKIKEETKPKPAAQGAEESEGNEASAETQQKPFYRDHPWNHFGTDRAANLDTKVRVFEGSVHVNPFNLSGTFVKQDLVLNENMMTSAKWNQMPDAPRLFKGRPFLSMPKFQLPKDAFFTPALEEPARKAVISQLRGKVEIFQKGSWQPAAVGMTLGETDEIRTSPGASANVLLDDRGSTGKMELKEKSYVRLNTMELNEQTKEKTTFIDLALGVAKLYVEKLKNHSKFEVHTPTAEVGVRGTVFEVEVSELEAGAPTNP